MRKICFYHAGCPDGFGAAWSVWRAWGDAGIYRPRGHHDEINAREFVGDLVAFVDIAPDNDSLRALADVTGQVVVLDHHVSARDRFLGDPSLVASLRNQGHEIHYDMGHSGASMAWQYFHREEPVPELLAYVEDQDLWNWKLPESEAVNAAIGSFERTFAIWDRLAATPTPELAASGASIVRSNQRVAAAVLQNAHPISVGKLRAEAVNATHLRSSVGHELARRAAFGNPFGLVYRITGERVDISLYSIGDFDVAKIAAGFGGGGHRNAAGLSVSLAVWMRDFI